VLPLCLLRMLLQALTLCSRRLAELQLSSGLSCRILLVCMMATFRVPGGNVGGVNACHAGTPFWQDAELEVASRC
jgi:hypothetical protein